MIIAITSSFVSILYETYPRAWFKRRNDGIGGYPDFSQKAPVVSMHPEKSMRNPDENSGPDADRCFFIHRIPTDNQKA